MRVARIALIALILGMSTAALALPSGGSVGGGSWGGGGGGGGGGAGGAPTTGQVRVDAKPLAVVPLVLFVAGGLAILGVIALIANAKPRGRRAIDAPRDVRVAVLHLAFDPSARERVQREMRALARHGAPTNAEERAKLLHDTATIVRRLVASSAYAGGTSEPAMTRTEARKRFQSHVAAIRALCDGEPPTRNLDDDGFGLVLVTWVIASRSDALAAIPTDHGGVTATLAAMCNVLPNELSAIEVLWTPYSGDDVMTAFALEARLGHALTKLDGVACGTSVCAYCNRAYRAEVVRCTHCGGQSAAATATRHEAERGANT